MDLGKFSMKTILIVDDERLVRDGLKKLVAPIPEFEVVGEVANGQEAIQWVAANLPNIVIMDVKMPVMDGLKATRHIKKLNLPVKVIVVSASINGETEALDAGADAFVSKYDPSERLLAALRSLSAWDKAETNDGFDRDKNAET
jgi:DNA-binding NarL/FixJ family response regulator